MGRYQAKVKLVRLAEAKGRMSYCGGSASGESRQLSVIHQE